LKKSGYNRYTLRFLIQQSGNLAYPEIRKIAETSTDTEIIEISFRKLAEDPENGAFLADLYTRKDWTKSRFYNDFETITSIVGPFLGADQRLKMFNNPGIVNNLSLKDFKPSKEEAAVALSHAEKLDLTHHF
jgi:hypothetical protein